MIKHLYFLLLFACSLTKAQIITTAAGNSAGFSGDGTAATQAQLSHPFSVACDNAGNFYIADRSNNRVRMVSSLGIITTIVGTGNAGYNGDNIAAVTAELNDPTGVTADNSGNVYIADRGNARIRKVNILGIITTIAGTGTPGYSGDGAAAAMAQLNGPRSVTVDDMGLVYIADQSNNRVRKIDGGGIITTIGGTGTAGYNGDGIVATTADLYNPAGMFVDAQGNVYVSDVDNQRVRKIDAGGIITTIAGTGVSGFSGDNGPATAARLSEPIAVTGDIFGQIYIADGWNNCVRMVNSAGIITSVAGQGGTAGYSGDGGSATQARLDFPYGVAIDVTGNLHIADYNNNRIRTVSNASKVNELAGKSTGIEVFPNPNNGTFKLKVSSSNGEVVKLVICNIFGVEVKKTTATTNCTTDMNIMLPAGIYMLSAFGKNKMWCEKMEVK